MRRPRSWILLATVGLLGACGPKTSDGGAASDGPSVKPPSASEVGPERGYDRRNFDAGSTAITNRWLPLKPGLRLSYAGQTIDGDKHVQHELVTVVTDLVKVIDGVRTVVLWERDFSAGKLEEAELAFVAQAKDGAIWRFGEYPEVYEDGKVVEAPAWIHGLEGAQAGITIKAEPEPGARSYAQGWGPAVEWSDRARIHQTGQHLCVRAGCYDGVLVTDEFSANEPGAHQFKYYAPGVGTVRVGWAGADTTKETLELVSSVQLSPAQLAAARAEALELEQHAIKTSKNVYARTTPIGR